MPWLTGEIPDDNDFICRRVRIPNEQTLRASVTGALLDLALCENWEKFGDLEPEDAEQLFIAMLQDFLEDDMCGIGKIEMYARDTLPANVLPCDGSQYDEADYPRLYEVLHPSLKNDITKTFTTPDLRDKFILAKGTTYPDFAETGGEIEHTLVIDEMATHLHITEPHNHTSPEHSHTSPPHSHTSPPHQHTYTQPTFGIDIESVGVPDPTGVGNPPVPQVTAPDTVIINSETVTINSETVTIDEETVNIEPEGGGNPHNNMPPYYVALMGIVAR